MASYLQSFLWESSWDFGAKGLSDCHCKISFVHVLPKTQALNRGSKFKPTNTIYGAFAPNNKIHSLSYVKWTLIFQTLRARLIVYFHKISTGHWWKEKFPSQIYCDIKRVFSPHPPIYEQVISTIFYIKKSSHVPTNSIASYITDL